MPEFVILIEENNVENVSNNMANEAMNSINVDSSPVGIRRNLSRVIKASFVARWKVTILSKLITV